MNIDSVNLTSSLAVYVQIENLVQFAIASGELKAGDQITSPGKVAKDLNLNVNTVTKAYRDLEIMGLLNPLRGMGFFVTKGAQKICRDRCYSAIMSRVYEVVQEAKAVGMSKAQLNEVVKNSIAAGGTPYGDVPAAVMKLAKKK